MTAYKLKLRPGGIIPPALTVGVELARAGPAGGEAAAKPTAPAAEPALPVGVDRWYDSAKALIPWQAYGARMLPPVNNWEHGGEDGDEPFTLDDEHDDEFDIENVSVPSGPSRSAWWMLTVPKGAPDGCLLTVDNFRSTPGGASTLDPLDPYVPDLTLHVVTTDVDPLPAPPWPSDALDFAKLYQVGFSFATPDPSTDKQSLSRIAGVPLLAGKTYWIRCDRYNSSFSEDDDTIYRLRLWVQIP